jgi:hypothetical protein
LKSRWSISDLGSRYSARPIISKANYFFNGRDVATRRPLSPRRVLRRKTRSSAFERQIVNSSYAILQNMCELLNLS